MGFGDFAKEVRKTTAKMVPSGKAENLIEAAENALPQTPVKKQDISYKDSEIQGFVPQGRSSMQRQSMDARHGSIIRNIASESNMNSQVGGEANWENCKHRKTNSGKDYCAEYHSLCPKEKCRKARR